MDQFFASIFILLSSTAKFGMVSLAVVASGLGIESALISLAGGIIGVVTFTYLGSKINDWLIQKWPHKYGKKFSKRSRMLVNIKNRFGLGGIAFLTPILLSIPVGVIFSLAITANKRRILWNMIAACVFWGVVIFVPYFAFGINVKAAIVSMF